MKSKFVFISLLSFLSACSRSSKSVLDYHLPLNQYSIGEYLQTENPNSLITVNRSSDQSGLVRIDPSTSTMSVLDATAKDAKDILFSSGKIIYRISDEIRFWNQRPFSIPTKVSKIRTFQWVKGFGRITYETPQNESRWLSFLEDGKIISDGPLPGSGRVTVANSQESLVFQNTDGLYLGKFGNQTEGIVEQTAIELGKAGAYAAARVLGDTLYIAYFDDDAGVLKLAKKASPGNNFTVEIIDGTPGQTYRGMDIAIFNDHGRPGFIYLDGWALKSRWARWINGKWATNELPFRGATGFYNVIVEENPTWILVGSHNFRSQMDDLSESFEDLALIRLDISGDQI